MNTDEYRRGNFSPQIDWNKLSILWARLFVPAYCCVVVRLSRCLLLPGLTEAYCPLSSQTHNTVWKDYFIGFGGIQKKYKSNHIKHFSQYTKLLQLFSIISDVWTINVLCQAPQLSPLSGAYCLIVVGEPFSEDHKKLILQKLQQGRTQRTSVIMLFKWRSVAHDISFI